MPTNPAAATASPSAPTTALRAISQAVNRAVRDLDKLTVAAINGFAIQTGFSLALACDFRHGVDRGASWASATLRFGLLPDEGGQWLLVQHLGVARTMDFLMRKRIVSGEEALRARARPRGVRSGRAARRGRCRWPASWPRARRSPCGMLKRSIYNAAELSFAQACDEIASKTAVTDWHPDAKEGEVAFREKRTPTFNAWLE